MNGECALVLPVTTVDGEPAMAKFGWPHEEAEFEYLALRIWGGNGAVRLFRADPRRYVLLLEAAEPGRDLTSVPELSACEIIAGLYPRLHVAAPPQVMRLTRLCERWSDALLALPAGAPVPRRYVERASALARDFATDEATDGRLLHADLHYDNVLAGRREPWLAIDPKPLSGDPSFEVAPLLWNRWDEATSSGDVRNAVRRRFHATVDAAGFDEGRARDWVIVREVVNVLWALDDVVEARGRSGRSPARMTAADREWITRCVTVAKAVQD